VGVRRIAVERDRKSTVAGLVEGTDKSRPAIERDVFAQPIAVREIELADSSAIAAENIVRVGVGVPREREGCAGKAWERVELSIADRGIAIRVENDGRAVLGVGRRVAETGEYRGIVRHRD